MKKQELINLIEYKVRKTLSEGNFDELKKQQDIMKKVAEFYRKKQTI